jgi:glycosyltransferase involved in cell wall biosynthesis
VRVLIDYRAALRERSGVGEYTHELVEALAATIEPSALDLTIFSSSWKDRLQFQGRQPGRVRTIDRKVPVSLLNFAWHRLEWPPAEVLAGRAFDVTHSLHPLLLPARHAAQVVTIHDLDFLVHPERTRAEIRRDYGALAADHARRADGVIVVSRFTASEVQRRLDVPPEKISVCSPGAPPWPARQAAPRDGYVLFMGTLEPRKNVGGLFDAYERLVARLRNPPPLVLAGNTTEASLPWLERASRPPLGGHVRHIGYVSPRDRRRVYESARLLVQPSFEEGFGIPVLEAMTLGVPVVASNRGALPEVLADAGALVDPDNSDDLANAIQRVLDDEEYAVSAAAKGVERAKAFSWQQTARHVYEAYRRAIEHRRCASA